jgi:integrase
MSIRKRAWTTTAGEEREAWQYDYKDQSGKRCSKQFARKRDAEDFRSQAAWEVKQGTHTADSQSITVAQAGDNWLKRGEREGLEQSTLNAYKQHVTLHIKPFLGERRLNQLTHPSVEEFRDNLLDNGRSRAMAKRVLGSLRSIIKEAKRTGYVAQNVAEGVTVKISKRDKKLAQPPSKADMRAMIAAAGALSNARPRDLPLLLVLLFGGLRASEVRGLPWKNVNLKTGTVHIDQRADYRNVIGPPKSASGVRTIPLPPMAVTELKKWKLRCPPSPLGLAFPSSAGTPVFHPNLLTSFLLPLQIQAGLVSKPTDGVEPVLKFGLHDFRHAAASMWIEQHTAPKRVQTWMGHHSIQVTFDTYGHLFDALKDDAAIMASLEAGLMQSDDETLASNRS